VCGDRRLLPPAVHADRPVDLVVPATRERGAGLGVEHGGTECRFGRADVVRVPGHASAVEGDQVGRLHPLRGFGDGRGEVGGAHVDASPWAKHCTEAEGLVVGVRGHGRQPFDAGERQVTAWWWSSAEQAPGLALGLLGGAGAALRGRYVTENLFDVVAAAPIGRLSALRAGDPLAHGGFLHRVDR